MGKSKERSKQEIKEALGPAKEEKTVALDELRAFQKENELKHGEDHSGDKKHGKAWKKLNDMYLKKKAVVDELKTELEGAKSEKKARATVYEYPMVKDETNGKEREMTAGEKKKYRTKKRAEKKKTEKGEDTPKKEKKSEKGGEEKKSEKKKDKKDKKDKSED